MAYKWQTERKNKTKKKIMDAAIKLIAEKGIHNAQIVEISTLAGVSAGTFYKYFEDKRDLFKFLAGSIGDAVIKAIGDRCDVGNANNYKDILEYVNSTLDLYFKNINKNKNIFLALTKGFFGTDDDVDKLVWEQLQRVAEELSNPINCAAELGVLTKTIDAKNVANILIGIVLEITMVMFRDGNLSLEEAYELTFKSFIGIFVPYLDHNFAKELSLYDGIKLIDLIFQGKK